MSAKRRRIRPLRALHRLSTLAARSIGLAPPLADRGYMICAVVRSGSTYLSELLGSTGVLGRPREYFNTRGRQLHFDPDYPDDRRSQLDVVRTTGATPNGIYGVKVLAQHLGEIGNRIDIFRDLPGLRLVRLNRRDVIGQAVSLMRTKQTGQFWSTHPQEKPAQYDAQLLRGCLEGLLAYRAIWDRTLAELNVTVLTFYYEDVERDPQAAVDEVATLMGLQLPVPIDPQRLQVRVMRDEQSAEWRARFLMETGAEFRHLAGD